VRAVRVRGWLYGSSGIRVPGVPNAVVPCPVCVTLVCPGRFVIPSKLTSVQKRRGSRDSIPVCVLEVTQTHIHIHTHTHVHTMAAVPRGGGLEVRQLHV
jgi:hypothetical protein